MVSRNLKLILFPSVVVLIIGAAFFNGFSYKTDSLFDIETGMSKKTVINHLLNAGVNYVSPETRESIVAEKGSAYLISEVIETNGICVNDHKRLSFKIKIDENGAVSNIVGSPYSNSIPGMVEVGDNITIVHEKLNYIVNSNERVKISSCIVGVNSFALNKSPGLNERLLEYDNWFIYIPNSHSTAILYFSEDDLYEIEFIWRIYER